MRNSQKMKAAIQAVIKEMMDRVMKKVLVEDPFIKEKHRAERPLYAALVPDEIFKGSHFERRFVTPFGNVWQKLAIVAAKEGMGHATQEFSILGKVRAERLRRIQEVLNDLEHSERGKAKIKPHWEKEITYILGGSGREIPTTVICDVYVEDRTKGKRYAFELKAPLPNSDQTKVSKEKIFKLYSMEPRMIEGAYFALPYNPYVRRENYDWSFPARWFNMKEDEAVLIGDEFWEKIGGIGTFKTFINAVNEIGREYRMQIYKEYLGIEPPSSADEFRL